MNQFWIGTALGFLLGAAVMIIAGLGRVALLQSKLASAQLGLLDEAEARLGDTFASLSLTALRDAKKDFLELAISTFDSTKEQLSGERKVGEKAIESLIKPIKEALDKIGEHTQAMEMKRASAYDGLKQHIEGLLAETTKLSSALRRPTVRGSWGELTLRTVCENAGLIQGQHFTLQDSTESDDGVLRPDMVVNLPRERTLIVDAKTPLDSFRDAMTAADEATRQLKLKGHAKSMRDHMKKLSAKSYWSRYSGSPDCVILFVPTEAAYFAAVETDPDLVPDAAKARVLIANPMTLVGLMRAVANVLDDERLHENAQEIKDIGRQLFSALRSCLVDLTKLGRTIRQSALTYNELVDSIDTGVMPRARRLRDLGTASGEDLPALAECNAVVRGPLSLSDGSHGGTA